MALCFAVSIDSQGRPKFHCEEVCSSNHLVLVLYVTVPLGLQSKLQILLCRSIFFPTLIATNINALFILNTILLQVECCRTFLLFSVDLTI